MKLEVKHNLNREELAKSLAAVAIAENVEELVGEALVKSWEDYEIPERYMREIVANVREDFRHIIDILGRNLEKWFNEYFPATNVLKKARGGLYLSQSQIEELKTLIEQHFRNVIQVGTNVKWDVPKELERKWKDIGLIRPEVKITGIRDAYVAGRLAQVLKDGDSYAKMLELAKSKPFSRVDVLAIRSAEENAAKYVRGFEDRVASEVEQRVLTKNKQVVNRIISQYMKGDLKETQLEVRRKPLADLLQPWQQEQSMDLTWMPAEIRAVETGRLVQGWRDLGRELYTRMFSSEMGRDWMRVAVSETRYAHNMGTIRDMQERNVKKIYYLVQPDACKYCKRLYLEADGVTPRIFDIDEILENIDKTGGMNVDRRPGMIGDEDLGWLPNALAHPWCRCRPREYIEGVGPVTQRYVDGNRKLS
ncbi:MAG: hypothetical protein ACYCX4_06905 [Bacillota bacterium]